MKKRYLVRVGLNYPPARRAEPGDIVDDIPQVSLPWLLVGDAERGPYIEPVADEVPAKPDEEGGAP